MATYNGEKYIREQLDSLAAQTLLPYELVVTDDGSTDATLDILEEFARTAPFEVRVFRNAARLGHGDNFLSAISYCRGELISCCDQDDIWLPQKLSKAVAPFRDAEVVMSSHNASVINEWGKATGSRIVKQHKRSGQFVEKRYWSINLGFTLVFRNHNVFMHMSNIGLRPFRDFGLQHDEVIYFLYTIWGKVAGIEDHLVQYRRHGANVSSATEGGSPPPIRDGLSDASIQMRRRCLMARKLKWPDPERYKMVLRAPLRTAKHVRLRYAIYDRKMSRQQMLGLIMRNLLFGVYSNSKRSGLGVRALARDITIVILGDKRPSLRSNDLRNKTC